MLTRRKSRLYNSYYKKEEAKTRRESGRSPQEPVKRYCWRKRTVVRFKDGKCMLEGCLSRLGEGCLQVMV